MKYSLKQLYKYVPELSSIPVDTILDKVWRVIAEVESVEKLEEQYIGTIVSKVVSVEAHPDSKKLFLVKLDIGTKNDLTVVTAANNMKKGDFVPYITEGSAIPAIKDKDGKDILIGSRDMGGIVSKGMIASEKEIGISDDHEGIMVMYQNEVRHPLVPGEAISVALEFDDVIFEIENKSLTNRGDCFSASGLAREIATLFSMEYVVPKWQKSNFPIKEWFGDTFENKLDVTLEINIQDKDSVERYVGIVLDAIEVAESPLWLKAFLQKHGIQSVNNVVDITNYVMLDYGQPMHAFDAGKISHKKRGGNLHYTIIPRHAKSGEQLKTLDGKDRVLPDTVTVIADENDAVAIAGIIGGANSEIDSKTTRIILESAVFDKYSIRNSSMKLGIVTDASVIFSRKQDAQKAGRALLRAVHLMQELAGAKIVSEVESSYITKPVEKTIIVSHDKIEHILGIAISPSRIVEIMERLGFDTLKKKGMYRLLVPTWRPDVRIDEDVYEEVARFIGYSEISPDLPKRGVFSLSLSKKEQIRQLSLKNLSALGMVQGMNFSFVSKALYDSCNISVEDMRKIVNAISPEVQFMRKQLLPGLFAQAVKNQYISDIFALFEFGKVTRIGDSYINIKDVKPYLPEAEFGIDEIGLPIEDEHLSIVVVDKSEQPGFYTVKYNLQKYLKTLGVTNVDFVHPSDLPKTVLKEVAPWIKEELGMLRSGRVALVKFAGEYIGVIGEPNTTVKKEFGITKNVGVAEIGMSMIYNSAVVNPIHIEPSKYPSITEDYCFLFSKKIDYAKLKNTYSTVLEGFSEVSVAVSPVDIYRKSETAVQYTHRAVFSSAVDNDLSPKLVRKIKDALVSAMKKLGGKLV